MATELNVTEDQIKIMVGRFLAWALPLDFNPDNGISVRRPNYAPGVAWLPCGTNLLNATQAEAMVRHMTAALPPVSDEGLVEQIGVALCQNALGGKRCPCIETGTFNCTDDYPGQQARAILPIIRAREVLAVEKAVGAAARVAHDYKQHIKEPNDWFIAVDIMGCIKNLTPSAILGAQDEE